MVKQALQGSLPIIVLQVCVPGCRGTEASSASMPSAASACTPCPPCITAALEPPKDQRAPTTDAGAGAIDAPELDGTPPFTGKVKEEPLSATPEQWLEFLARAARYKGKDIDRVTWQKALSRERSPADAGSSVWGKLCSDVGFATDENLRPLCTTDFEWSLTLDVADMDGDGRPEYWLFGTWVTFDHHDGLLAIFTPKEGGVIPLRRLDALPENGPGLNFSHPFLVKTGHGVKLTSTHAGDEIQDPDYVARGGRGFYQITRQFETRGGAFLLIKETKALSEPAR